MKNNITPSYTNPKQSENPVHVKVSIFRSHSQISLAGHACTTLFINLKLETPHYCGCLVRSGIHMQCHVAATGHGVSKQWVYIS